MYLFKVEIMANMGIHQSQASKAMVVMGTADLVGRATISYLGNHVKGFMLHIYSAICLVLCVANVLAYFATSLKYLICYVAGRYCLVAITTLGSGMVWPLKHV